MTFTLCYKLVVTSIVVQLISYHQLIVCLQADDKRKISICESVASTISVDHPSEEELSSDDDNGEDNGDSSDTASAPSPRPQSMPTPPPAVSNIEPSLPSGLLGG